MSLKADRYHVESDISWFMNAAATRGGVVSISTAGSGAAMDQAAQVCAYAASPSGSKPLGFLMCDVVNYDLTRQKLNPYKHEVQVGSKVTIWKKGWVLTDYIYPGATVTAGGNAMLGPSGYIQVTFVNHDATPIIGKFDTTKDADGYARVSINLPSVSQV